MQNILVDFPNKENDEYLYILPIERFSISYKLKVENVVIYPSGMVDIDELFKLQVSLEDNSSKINKLKESTLIAFLAKSQVEYPAQGINNLTLLNYAVTYTTPILDFIIFNYCNINNNSSLPSRVGQIETGESILLMFNEFYFIHTRIICERINTNTITLGNGLVINDEPNLLNAFPLLNNDINEIGNVAIHALRMYTQILESNSNTEKFIQLMLIFEFIASPNKYEKFQNVKAKIISHIAKNNHQIHEISKDFKYYSSGNNGDGLRTQIFHKGKKIEQLMDENKQKELFKKLHKYIFTCITDLLNNYNKNWEFIEEFRTRKREDAEKNKSIISTDNYSSTIVLIDGDFLSRAIIQRQKWYSELYPQKELNTINLATLCSEILLNTRKWKKGEIFGFLIFYSKISKFPFVNETFNDMNDKAIKLGATEFEFRVFQHETKAKLLADVNSMINDLNKDRKITDICSVFENIVFCGDNKNYENSLIEVKKKGTKDIVLIRSTHDTEMKKVNTSYFPVGYLIGRSLGLKNDEL